MGQPFRKQVQKQLNCALDSVADLLQEKLTQNVPREPYVQPQPHQKTLLH